MIAPFRVNEWNEGDVSYANDMLPADIKTSADPLLMNNWSGRYGKYCNKFRRIQWEKFYFNHEQVISVTLESKTYPQKIMLLTNKKQSMLCAACQRTVYEAYQCVFIPH